MAGSASGPNIAPSALQAQQQAQRQAQQQAQQQAQHQAQHQAQQQQAVQQQMQQQQKTQPMQPKNFKRKNTKELSMAGQEQNITTPSFGSPAPLSAPTDINAGAGPQGVQAAPGTEARKLRDYQMGLMLLEQQNKPRLFMARTGDNDASAAAPPPPPPSQPMAFGSAAPSNALLHDNAQLNQSATMHLTTPRRPSPSAGLFGRSALHGQSSSNLGELGFDDGGALEDFDFDSFLHNPKDNNFGTSSKFDFNEVEEFSGQSPQSIGYSPVSPGHSPRSLTYAPMSLEFAPMSPSYTTASPGNSPFMQSSWSIDTSHARVSPHASPSIRQFRA